MTPPRVWGTRLRQEADKLAACRYGAPMFGAHLSISGGLHNALLEARRLDMDCVQVFTKNQRQWKVPPLTAQQVDLWKEHQRTTGITNVVSHDSYLINLASPDPAMRRRSIALFRHELLRCETLGIPLLVTHPGAHMQSGEDAGLRRVARSLDRLHRDLPGLRTVTCLEVTAGQGTSLGSTFEHLKRIFELVSEPRRLAVCLDTAHLLAAGYDLGSAGGARGVVQELDDVLGLALVRALHLNDSKTPRGSRVDRHAHIGQGHVSLEALGVLINNSKLLKLPKILETPKGEDRRGRPWDRVNLAVVRKLRKGRSRARPGPGESPE